METTNDLEEKYRKIFKNVQDVFYQTDLEGLITEISPSVSKYSAYVGADLIGKPIQNFYYYPDERQKVLKLIQEKGEILDYELLLRGKDGQKIWASLNAHFIFDNDGSVKGIEGSIRDITKRKNAEEKLKLSLSLLQATLDSTSDSLLVIDLYGKVSSYNTKFKELFQVPDSLFYIGEDGALLEFVIGKFKEPEKFLKKIKYLYANPEIESHDRLELTDGRILDRFSFPQIMDGAPVGRVWKFTDITERIKHEQQLNLMAHTLKSINECISITDTQNDLLFVNEAFLNTYGYTKEELIGHNVSMIRSPHNDPEVVDKILNITATEGWQGEIMNRRKDGTDFPISLSTSLVLDENGKILGMVGVAVDITERKQAEKALQESRNKYKLLIQSMGEGFGVADPDENLIFVNPAAEQIFGVEPGTLTGRNLREFIVPELFTHIVEESKKRANNEQSTYETEIITPKGKRKSILVTATPQTDDEGRFTGTFGIFRDITDRKIIEEELRESEKKYRNLIERMPDGVYRSTPEGKFLVVNDAMVKMLGYESKEELIAIDIPSQLYFKPEDRESLVLDEDLTQLDVYPLKKKDGTAVWVEDHGWYIKDETGNILYHEGISRDVTERRTAEIQLRKYSEELQELNATKDKFFSIIAHDLKTPFNSILGLSEILKDEAKNLDIATIEQYSGIIHSTSTNTFRLLENLLDWARVQQSRIKFTPEPIILKKTVNEVVELMIEKANSKMIAIINFVPNSLIISADKDMLKTTLRNLISNALKFTHTNGTIEIHASEKPGEVEIKVKDSGIGISKEDAGKLFKAVSNFTKRGTENEKGTGLGLMLCKEFVEKHGGKIWIESEEGKGSTFSFTLKQY